jgi:hypothetical protein
MHTEISHKRRLCGIETQSNVVLVVDYRLSICDQPFKGVSACVDKAVEAVFEVVCELDARRLHREAGQKVLRKVTHHDPRGEVLG